MKNKYLYFSVQLVSGSQKTKSFFKVCESCVRLRGKVIARA